MVHDDFAFRKLREQSCGYHLFFPQIADGGGYISTIVLVDTGGTPVEAPWRFLIKTGSAQIVQIGPTKD